MMPVILETDPKFSELDEFIDSLPDKRGMLIGVLHKAQEIFGYLPKEVQHHVAEKLQIPESNVFGVVTFYSFFTMKPRGKYQIKVCLGTACYVKGGQKISDTESNVFGVVTFYSFFTMKPRGKYQIKVCLGTACYVKGGQKISDRVKEELGVTGDEPTPDGLFSVQEVRCLGACSMAPVMLIGERDFYGRLTPDKVRQIIETYKRKENKK